MRPRIRLTKPRGRLSCGSDRSSAPAPPWRWRAARAPFNGLGIAGVAPRVDIVNLRADQDSGYFFIQPTVDALTYAGDQGIDVVNMSFYIDPWLYN